METKTNENARDIPWIKMKKRIEDEGIVVVDYIDSLPTQPLVSISPFLVFSLTHKGQVKLKYDDLRTQLLPKDIAVFTPNHLVEDIILSPNYASTVIIVSGSLLEQMRQHASYRNFLAYHKNPSFHLTDEQYEAISHLLALMRSTTNSTKRRGLQLRMLELMYLLVDEYRLANYPEDMISDSPVFTRFYDSLAEHYRESREVKYYAEQLCLSPKYFGTLIRQETGTSASRWIANYVVMQAKQLLVRRRNLSIQQVSQLLGFPDQATFARYFKVNTGLTPKAYRSQQ